MEIFKRRHGQFCKTAGIAAEVQILYPLDC